jgi:hypothetical protein
MVGAHQNLELALKPQFLVQLDSVTLVNKKLL